MEGQYSELSERRGGVAERAGVSDDFFLLSIYSDGRDGGGCVEWSSCP